MKNTNTREQTRQLERDGADEGAEQAAARKHRPVTSSSSCALQAWPQSHLYPGLLMISFQTSFHISFFLTKLIPTLFWEVEAVSIFRKPKCQKSSERHNWEVKNSWYDWDQHQIANIWNSSPSGPWGEKGLCLLNWLTDDLALLCCVGCWMGRRSQRKVKYLSSTCCAWDTLLDTEI